MACSFDICSVFADVNETIATLPKEPNELKTVLMAHLGITDLLTNSSEKSGGGGSGSGGCMGADSTTTATSPPVSVMSNVFKHPITYIDPLKIHELPSSIIEDLEMVHTKPKMEIAVSEPASVTDPESDLKGLYHYVFNPSSVYGNEYLPIWSKYYSTDIEYLKNTQTLLTYYDNEILHRAVVQNTAHQSHDEACLTMKDTWSSFRGSGKISEFKEKFSYVETPILSKLNQSSPFLQILTVYNISSPVITLLTPIIVIIVPFIILFMRGVQINVNDYIEILKTIVAQHSIGKFFTEFDTVTIEQKMYILMSIVFYFIQIYQNIMACVRFYNNIKLVHTHLNTIHGFLTVTGVNMTYMIQLIQTYHLHTYEGFKNELVDRYTLLSDFTRALSEITPFSPSISKFLQIGVVMKNYYALFSQTDLNELLEYSFGFNAYIEHLTACRNLVINGKINACKFVKTAEEAEAAPAVAVAAVLPAITENDDDDAEGTDAEATEATETPVETLPPPSSPPPPPSPPSCTPATNGATATKLNSQFYAPLLSGNVASNAVPNDIHLNKQLIITGPNAAGKTTTIKATLFNIILSQQIGYGFYKSAQINPYEYLHCYLNIPDTSGRDSLFQAESRRCKEILTCMLDHPKDRHFCIFDELYSGTNPYEAVASAYGYIDFISKNPNVDLILTTHYIDLCHLLEKHERIENLHMSTAEDGAYLYKIADGISTIKGGLKVLRELDYPAEIVDSARRIIERKI
jgi:ABC-type multidrug transport system fused ATPase/permease subunit